MNAITSRGLSWDGEGKRHSVMLLGALVLFSLISVAPVDAAKLNVIVGESHAGSGEAAALVERLGGSIRQNLELIGGFSATIPASAITTLSTDDSVAFVSEDGRVALSAAKFGENVEASSAEGSMMHVVQTTGAEAFWSAGYRGQNVTVALIDSGVVPVDGLTISGKVVNGLDISFESQLDSFRYLDTYGHGTHMASIIAGKDVGGTSAPKAYDPKYFYGIAPDSRILNVKVAAYDGAVDVSQVIAAIDWLVTHRNDNGMNVRVLNLSFGTNSAQSYLLDPLSFAVEQAWKSGIVVVAAVGNDGSGSSLRNPASDPYVIAVGAVNTNGTVGRSDDKLASFSNCDWKNSRNADLLAPGVSVLGLRSPGSYADLNYPSAAVGSRYFKGSGTSQSTAVVSGAAALFLSKFPSATPDQVKAALTTTATKLGLVGKWAPCEGRGSLNLANTATLSSLPNVTQIWTPSTGLGSLESARGTDHLTNDGVMLTGEKDIFAKTFSTVVWAPLSAAGSSWSDGTWNGSSWSGSSWSGSSWSGSSWSGSSWSGSSWSGSSWSGSSWSGSSWSNMSWSGSSWSGSSWSGSSWSGSSWSGSSWSGQRWG